MLNFFKKNRKVLLSLFLCTFILGFINVGNATAQNSLTIMVNNKVLEQETPVVYDKNCIFIPINLVCEEFNAKVGFDEEENILIIRQNFMEDLDINKAITTNPNHNKIIIEVNGFKKLDFNVYKIGENFFIPGSLFEEIFGAKVSWEKVKKIVEINSDSTSMLDSLDTSFDIMALIGRAEENLLLEENVSFDFKGFLNMNVDENENKLNVLMNINMNGAIKCLDEELYLNTELEMNLYNPEYPNLEEISEIVSMEIYAKDNNFYMKTNENQLWVKEVLPEVDEDTFEELSGVRDFLEMIDETDSLIKDSLKYIGIIEEQGRKYHIIELNINNLVNNKDLFKKIQDSAQFNVTQDFEDVMQKFSIKATYQIDVKKEKFSKCNIQVVAMGDFTDENYSKIIFKIFERINIEYYYDAQQMMMPVITEDMIKK